MVKDCPTIIMKVNKSIYLHNGSWSTVEQENNDVVIKGRFLAFSSYWYSVINPVTEEDKKNSMTIIMYVLDKMSNRKYPLGSIEIHPYELNELIKEGAIEIV